MLLLIACPVQAKEYSSFREYKEATRAILWAANKAGISPKLLGAICYGESAYKANSTHMDGSTKSYSICQVKLSTAQYMDTVYKHRHLVTEQKLENIYLNAFYAAKIIKFQLKRYFNNYNKAIDAYNKGHAIDENSKYIKRILLIQEKLNKPLWASL